MRNLDDKQTSSSITSGLRIGYARKSTEDQSLDLQVDALKKAGCQQIYSEQVSRSGPKRKVTGTPELNNCLRALRPGDTLVVWRLDRLSGSLKELLTIMDELKDRKINFQSLTESIDTSSAVGQMFFQICGVFAAYERNQLIERTNAGLAAARARGRNGGRPPVISDEDWREIKVLIADPSFNITDIARRKGVSKMTIYRHMRKREILEQADNYKTTQSKV